MALAATAAAVMALALPAYAHTQISHGKCIAGGGVPVTIAFKGTCVGGNFNGQPIDNPTEAAPGSFP